VQLAVRANAVLPGSDALDSVSSEKRPWLTLRLNASPRLLILLALLLMLLSIWGWQEYNSREASAVPAVNTTSAIEPPVVFVCNSAPRLILL
jgi:hypothetical protein